MGLRIFVPTFIFTFWVTVLQAWGEPHPCTRSFLTYHPTQVSSSADFLSSFNTLASPVTLNAISKSGELTSLPLTYSIDSEVDASGILRLIDLQGPYVKKMTSYTSKMLADEVNAAYPHRSVSDWAYKLKVSESQFRTMVLKKGIDSKLNEYTVFDLKPGFLKGLPSWTLGLPATLAFKHHPTLAPKMLIAIDDQQLEFRNATFEAIPNEYQKLITDFHQLFPAAQTHFHIGIPASAISRNEFTAVAQVMEARIILKLIEAFRRKDLQDPHLKLAWSDPGPLLRTETNRGVITYTSGEFEAYGHTYHNLEIRQHDTIQDGLNQVGFASYLFTQAKRLRVVNETYYGNEKHISRYLGNVTGTVLFLLNVMSEQHHWLAARQELESLVTARDPTQEIDAHEIALDLQPWLKKWKILDAIEDPEFFLN